MTQASSFPSSFLLSVDEDEFVATSWIPLRTITSFLALNIWELEHETCGDEELDVLHH